MIPAIFAVGEAVSHEAQDLHFTKPKDKLTVDCKIRGVQFRGVETTDDHEKYAFVLRNKATGKIKVVTSQPLIFRPFKEDKDAATVSTMPLERTALVEAFGSGKKLRAMQARQQRESLTGSARGIKAVVEAAAKDASSTATEDTTGRDRSSLVPPVLNANAIDPAQVYDIDALVPAAVRAALKEEADTLAESSPAQRETWKQENTYADATLSRLRFLPVEPEARSAMAAELALLHHMLLLSKMPASALRSAAPLKTVPPPVAQFLLRSFTLLVETPTRRVRCCPTWMKDKLMCHVLVLILHIDHYKTELAELTSQLKKSTEQLKKFFQALGCKIQTGQNKSNKFAVLTPPLAS